MATKLNEITTQYHTFVDNQVLTKDQLNEFIGYFEDQDRLSRIFLSGVGIVCGFNLRFDSSKPSVTITQGAGVTTDGDLIKLRKDIPESPFKTIDFEEIEYRWVKKFEDSFANYRFFKRLQTVDGKVKEVPLELWEILPEKTENSNDLSTLTGLNDKVVLLYLESYAKEGDLCTSVDCDNQGVEQVARLRVLLVSKEDAKYILGLDSIFSKHNIVDSYFSLPEVAVRRVILNQLNTVNYNELKRAYHDALNGNSLITDLVAGISKVVKDFRSILKLDITDSVLNSYIVKLKSVVAFSAYNVPFNVQYRYDCIKDVVDTFNEIKTLLLSLKEECCPDIKAFPKHLMLGSLDEIQEEIKHYRHDFYRSPILNGGNHKILQCRSLVLRLFQIVVHFQTMAGQTKITPSNKLPELSLRAIPFYYNIQEDFLKKWNFFKTEKYKSDTNLSYHTSLLSPAPSVQEPLLYNTDRFDFYRIEGHQGKSYAKVLEEIDDLKIKYGLAFDVKALSVNINRENLNIDDYECEFEDLNVLLRAWTTEQDCILAQVSQFFSGFSTKQPGANVKDVAVNVAAVSAAGLRVGSSGVRTASLNISGLANDVQAKAASVSYKAESFSKSKVVTENLTLSEDALGIEMKKAFDETKGGSVNDIIAKATELVSAKVNTDVWKEQPEVKALVIDQSIGLMAYSHVLSQRMPGILADVSIASVATYKLTLKELCARVEKLKVAYQNVELSASLKALMGVLIIQLSSICCSAKKLEILLEEINKRKENILLRLQLAKFVEKYPGLEHKAGVEPGGTFVLVYLNKIQTVPGIDVSRDIDAAAKDLSAAGTRPVSAVRMAVSAGNVSAKELAAGNLAISENLESIIRSDLLNRLVSVTELPNNTVVADFSLPYMCCSDCAPVNFIVQRPPVSLRLEQDHFCLGKDTSPLLFEVSPADGVIKADQQVEGMTIDGIKLSFDPASFPDTMIGKTIHFTANDQITDCEIAVYRTVEFDFAVPESPTTQTEITFVPTGENLDGATFLWSFGDDNMSEARNPTHKYTLPVNEENKVTVTLTVTAANGVCHNTVEHEITFAEVEPEINIDGRDFCSNDPNPHLFGITPDGAVVKIEGPGVETDPAGRFVFIPAKAGTGEVEFLLNANPSGLKVTVHPAPVAVFTPSQVGNQLVLANNSTGANLFVWNINGEKLERDNNESVIIELTPNSPTTWRLALEVFSEFCGSDATGFISFETRWQEPAGNCAEETKASLLKDLETLQGLNLPGSNFVVPIWMSTSRIYGGTDEFKEGVLNDLDNYLSGKNNEKLPELYLELPEQTSSMIIELAGNPDSQEFQNLLGLFALQLSLFYNVLGCQENETVDASVGVLSELLKRMITILRRLKEFGVALPETLREFIVLWGQKIKGVGLFEEHFKIIQEENLI
jgi:PKD repeat protein